MPFTGAAFKLITTNTTSISGTYFSLTILSHKVLLAFDNMAGLRCLTSISWLDFEDRGVLGGRGSEKASCITVYMAAVIL